MSTQYDWNDEDLEPEPVYCPSCYNEAFFLGSLGRLDWFRCRACGMEFYHDTQASEPSPVEPIPYDNDLPALIKHIGGLLDWDLYYVEPTQDQDGNDFWIFQDWDSVHKMEADLWSLGASDPKVKGWMEAEGLEAQDNDRSCQALDRLMDCQWGFSDEYATCSDCGLLIRTSPDSYDWQADFWSEESGLLCKACVLADYQDAYLEWAIWNPKRAINTDLCDLEEAGFQALDLQFENGLHPGMNDDPKMILQACKALKPKIDLIFTLEPSQFYVTFRIWARWNPAYREDQEENGTPLEDGLIPDMVLAELQAHYRKPVVGPSDRLQAALRSIPPMEPGVCQIVTIKV